MDQIIKVYQIYFDEKQFTSLDYIPFLNENCTPFFESEVIKKLIEEREHLEADYFGVVSHKLREKIRITKETWRGIANICNTSNQQFSPELFQSEILTLNPDVMSFQRHMPHDPISFADKFHPNFSKYFKEIMQKIGYEWSPIVFKDVFYCNFFVAKSEIYEKYVKEMLAPAMEVMRSMPELMYNSNYPHTLPDKLKDSFGINHYPYQSFLCERMISYFVHIHQYKCNHF